MGYLLASSHYVIQSTTTFIIVVIILYYLLTGKGNRIGDVQWLLEGKRNIVLMCFCGWLWALTLICPSLQASALTCGPL